MQKRFLSIYLDPKTGRERLGSGGSAQAIHHYANVGNVIKFGLAKNAFPAGQYNIYEWTPGNEAKFITRAYKLV